MSRDDIRKALPGLDEQAVDLMADTGVSVPLVSTIVAVLHKHGHVMPTAAAEQSDAAARTIRAVVGLVDAFEGRDPFGALPAAHSPQERAAALKHQLHGLSPVAHADEYRSLFAELVKVEAEVHGQREAPALLAASAAPAVRSCEVLAEYEVHVDELKLIEREAPNDAPIRILVGHLPMHLPSEQEAAIVHAAYWRSRVTLVGSGPGLKWLQDNVTRYVADQIRSDAAYAAQYPYP